MKTDLQKELDSNIPETVIKSRLQGGIELSYLDTFYVIDRLNQVLGQGNWAYTSEVNCVRSGTVETKSGTVNSVHYIARVRLVVTIGESSTEFTDYGYGDGTDRNNPGKAHELAVKEAVTDGLKRCTKNLGRSMGLALYDKTQEFVGENKTDTKIESKGTESRKMASSTVEPSRQVVERTVEENRKTRDRITATFKVLEAQKKITKEEFKTKYQGGKGISTLTDGELNIILKNVKQDFNL